MMIERYYVTILSNFSRGYNKYTNTYDKKNIPAKFPDKFFLLKEADLSIGIQKNRELLERNGDDRDKVIVIETDMDEPLFNDHETGVGHYIKRDYISVAACYIWDAWEGEFGEFMVCKIEDLMAQSLALQNFVPYGELKPRSVSVLPVAKGCQAACSFCFSKSSVSDDLKGTIKDFDVIEKQLILAKEHGAERAVITGGGEPTLMDRYTLHNLIYLMKQHFPKVVMITNGYSLSKMDKDQRQSELVMLNEAGLNVLAISHHHHYDSINTKIMSLEINIDDVLRDVVEGQQNLTPRLICVLQKGGVENQYDISEYLQFADRNGVSQVCFKELYVSTSTESYYHNHASNVWSRNNQVPLSVLTNYLENTRSKIVDRLPWGAPVYDVQIKGGHVMRVAAYTEPSLFWERTTGIARSWNIMSNGQILASLEDKSSEITSELPTV